MKKNGLILYESRDAAYNSWFIDKLTEEFLTFNIETNVVYTDLLINANNGILTNAVDELIKNHPNIDFVINRTRQQDIVSILEKRGIRIINPVRVTRICNDKDLTYQFASENHVPFLPYMAIDTARLNEINDLALNFGFPFVLKPVDGHGGKHVFMINDSDELQSAIDDIISSGEAYQKLIIQRIASKPGCDLRVYLINNEVIVSMLRESENYNDFRANFSLGGKATAHELTDKERKVVNTLSKALPSDFIGIDFVYNGDDEPLFNEIEDAVGSRMVYANTDIDILKLFVEHIVSTL